MIASVPPRGQRARLKGARIAGGYAFTLIEVILAVAILGMMTASLYRFVVSNLDAIRFSTEDSVKRNAVVGLVNLVEAQLQDLPAQRAGVLIGLPHKTNNQSFDELQWLCRAGQGLMTTAAEGEYRVTMTLQALSKTSAEQELGLRRRPMLGSDKDADWVPLLTPCAALEIRYFHPQLNAWVDRWNDQNRRPALVRLTITRFLDEPPYEAIISLPAASVQGGGGQ